MRKGHALATPNPCSAACFLQGLLASTVSVLLFGAPLAELGTIIQNADSSSMPITQIAAGALTAFWWTVYGAYTGNPFITVPNALGTVLSVAQLLIWRNYRKPSFA